MKIKIYIMKAFSIDGTGGNPAGIVFDSDHLSTLQKQTIASLAGFPETAFVSSSLVADFKLDFFTPVKQIPHCGHATIATFSYLKQNGKIKGDHSSKETIDGNRSILFKGNLAFMEQRAPVFTEPEESISAILKSLNIKSADLMPGLKPTIVNTGNSFLMVPLSSVGILQNMMYDKDAVTDISKQYELIGFYPFIIPADSVYDASARMFGPYYGIAEEAGTGMAAGPLACFLYQTGFKKNSYLIEQGKYMHPSSPSRIQVDLETNGTEILQLFAGGASYVAGEKTVEIE